MWQIFRAFFLGWHAFTGAAGVGMLVNMLTQRIARRESKPPLGVPGKLATHSTSSALARRVELAHNEHFSQAGMTVPTAGRGTQAKEKAR